MLKDLRLDKSVEGGDTNFGASLDDSNVDYSFRYASFIKQFKATKEVVEVDFRKEVKFRSGIDRYTHLIHPYPAKLLLNIPYFFINCNLLSKPGDTVLDPFCGSGTVLLESILAGRSALGADANPLARLIAKCKNSIFDTNRLSLELNEIVRKAKSPTQKLKPQKIVDWKRWYTPRAINDLSVLKKLVYDIEDDEIRSYFETCLSLAAKKMSFCDPSVSVPVKLNPERFEDGSARNKLVIDLIKKIKKSRAVDVFETVAKNNIKRFCKLQERPNLGKVHGVYEDSRRLEGIVDGSVDLIVTSPPYAGAQKYIRSSSLGIGWLDLTPDGKLRTLEKKNIGREHYSTSEYSSFYDPPIYSARKVLSKVREKNPLRSHIASNYLSEMKDALIECRRVLRSGGHMVLVVGNNVVCGEEFQTRQFLEEICLDMGFKVEVILRDEINSRGLMTKRNKTASVIACEWITVFKKT